MNTALRLQKLRKENGYSQEELAELLNISRQAVSKWESGSSSPDLNNLIQLSELYHVSVDSMIKGERPVEHQQDVGQNGTPEKQQYSLHDYRVKYRPKYEYRSKRTFLGLPLLHVHIGMGLCKAKGWIAIGNVAVGLISLGLFSAGLISIGVVAVGLLALAAVALGGIAFGALAAGFLAFGAVAVGYVAIGGLAIGAYALGGYAQAADIAMGGYASGKIAIGDQLNGQYLFHTNGSPLSEADARELTQCIDREFPNLWVWLRRLFTMWFV